MIMVTEVATGETIRASERADGIEGDGDDSSYFGTGAVLSGDGKYVVFQSSSINLVDDDDNNVNDIFVKRAH